MKIECKYYEKDFFNLNKNIVIFIFGKQNLK